MSRILFFGSDFISEHTLRAMFIRQPAFHERISLIGPPVLRNRNAEQLQFLDFAKNKDLKYFYQSSFDKGDVMEEW